MIKFKSKLIAALFIALSGAAMASMSLGLAWFASNVQEFNDTEVSGALLESYFDKKFNYTSTAEPGTANNPFVITRPIHYENLVKLYTREFYVSGTGYVNFSSKNFVFEIGKQDSASGSYFVYDYDKYGVTSNAKSSTNTLNIYSLGYLEPIGNDAHPFNATIIGHNMCISDFRVSSTAKASSSETFCDVGIFGYVSDAARVSNLYFKSFTISLNGSAPKAHTNTKVYKHDSSVSFGYLAGHIMTYESFVNVYVNDCKVDSTAVAQKSINQFGYYGLCEKDKNGSGLPDGRNYSYTFDSQVWHEYFNTNLSAISSQQLVIRNTEDGAGYEDNIIEPANEKFGSAVQHGDVLTSYYINGKNTRDSYTGRNFSLSTMGYVSGQKEVKELTGDVRYTLNNGQNYTNIPGDASLYEYSGETAPVPTDFHDGTNGDYYYYNKDSTDWRMIHGQNHVYNSTDYPNETASLIFNFYDSTMTFDTSKFSTSYATKIELYIFLDDQNTSASGTYKYKKVTGTAQILDDYHLKFHLPTVEINNVPLGSHSLTMFIYKEFTYKTIGIHSTVKQVFPLFGSYSASGAVNKRKGEITSAGSFSYSDYGYTDDNRCAFFREYKLSDYESSTQGAGGASWQPYPSTIAKGTAYDDSTMHMPNNTYVKGFTNVDLPLYFHDDKDQTDNCILMKTTTDQNFANAYLYHADSKIKAKIYAVTISDKDKKRHFTADEPEVNPEGNEYKGQAIDVVGGGVGFYYYEYYNIFSGQYESFKMCRVYSEHTANVSKTVVKEIKASDIGTKFYATSRCNQSIVLFVKNIGSATNNVDENLGSMTFKYYQLSLVRTVHPSFKKGASSTKTNYGDFEDDDIFGDPTDGDADESSLVQQFKEKTITETIAKKCSYCAIDENGMILGCFDRDGKPGIGFTGSDATEKLEKIDRYVIAIGSFTSADSADWALWIKSIKFNYKADVGETGTFGPVGYRDRADTIENTILNFYLKEVPASVQFSIHVNFTKYETEQSGKEGEYVVTIKNESKTTDLNFNFYNYLYTKYLVKVTIGTTTTSYTAEKFTVKVAHS